MSRFFPDELIEEIRQRNEISSVIATYFPLKRAGRNFKALCPFHGEKTPSFHVNTEKQIFHCFGCDKGGNVYTFVMEIDRLSFPEAVEQLATRAGIPLPERTAGAPRQKEDKAILYRANDWACQIYQEALQGEGGAEARDYLTSRGINEQSVGRFRIGFAPAGWETLAGRLRGKPDYLRALHRAGLVIERDGEGADGVYDRFRNRLIFPILDGQGRVLGFGARTLDGSEPKYLNSPETPIFNKRRELYALGFARNAARQSKRLVLTEGYTDVIMAHQHGFGDFVASLGTALTAEHVGLVRRHVDEAVVLYDGDAAGRAAANRAVELFVEGEMAARFAAIAPGHDPCSLLEAGGKEQLQTLLDTAVGPIEFLLAGHEEALSPEARAGVVEEVIGLLARVRNPVRRELLATELAQRTRISGEAITSRLATRTQPVRVRPEVTKERNTATRIEPFDIGVLELALMAPALHAQLAEQGLLDRVHNPEVKQLCSRWVGHKRMAVSEALSHVENPALAQLVIGFSEREVKPEEYEKGLHDLTRRAANEKATEASLPQLLAQAEAEGDEARQMELLREIHRVHEHKIRSLNG